MSLCVFVNGSGEHACVRVREPTSMNHDAQHARVHVYVRWDHSAEIHFAAFTVYSHGRTLSVVAISPVVYKFKYYIIIYSKIVQMLYIFGRRVHNVNTTPLVS